MIGTLRDLTKHTMIASLPNIINWNNEQIKAEFDNLYNSENDTLIKSVYVPKGTVTAHTGNFINLRVHTLTIEDPSSLESLVLNIKHNDTKLRLSGDFQKADLKFRPDKDYAHDMLMIKDLVPTINDIKQQLKELWLRVSPKDSLMDPRVKGILDSTDDLLSLDPDGGSSSGGKTKNKKSNSASLYSITQGLSGSADQPGDRNYISNGSTPLGASGKPQTPPADDSIIVNEKYIKSLESEANFYVYEDSLYTRNPDEIKDKIKNLSDLTDIKNNLKCRYVLADSRYVKIDNSLPTVIQAVKKGQVINIIFEAEEDNRSNFILCLKKGTLLKDYTLFTVPSNKIETSFLTLICTDIDVEMGPTWRVIAGS